MNEDKFLEGQFENNIIEDIKEKKKRGRKTGYKRSEKEIKKMVETRARNKLAYGGYTKLEDEVNNDL